MSIDKPALSLGEAQEAVAAKTAPKVTVESIEAKIASVDYLTHGLLTVAVITMRNGFKTLGKAASASPENHDPEIGRRYAYEDAFRPLWQLEGYLLRERLSAGEA
jgi:hypothetical protein